MFASPLLLLALAAAGAAETAECAAIREDERRLACYDALFGAAGAGLAGGGAVKTEAAVADAASVQPVVATTPQQDFGLTGEQLAERDGKDDALDQMTATVVEIHSSRVGKPAYTLDNGQRWRQLEATSRPRFKIDQRVLIRKASLGSFLATTPDVGGAPIRLRREK